MPPCLRDAQIRHAASSAYATLHYLFHDALSLQPPFRLRFIFRLPLHFISLIASFSLFRHCLRHTVSMPFHTPPPMLRFDFFFCYATLLHARRGAAAVAAALPPPMPCDFRCERECHYLFRFFAMPDAVATRCRAAPLPPVARRHLSERAVSRAMPPLARSPPLDAPADAFDFAPAAEPRAAARAASAPLRRFDAAADAMPLSMLIAAALQSARFSIAAGAIAIFASADAAHDATFSFLLLLPRALTSYARLPPRRCHCCRRSRLCFCRRRFAAE